MNFLTAGGQTVSIIVTEQTFESTYEDMNVSRKVLSRTLEDSGTLSAPIVPWGVATIYVMGVLGAQQLIFHTHGLSLSFLFSQ